MTGSYNKERTGLIFSRNHPSPPENKKAVFSPSWLWYNRKYSSEWVQDMWKLAGSQKSGSYFPIQSTPPRTSLEKWKTYVSLSLIHRGASVKE